MDDPSVCKLILDCMDLNNDTASAQVKKSWEKIICNKETSAKEKVLTLQYNDIDELETENIPTVIHRLLVNVNKLTHIPALKAYKNLIELSLSYNVIVELDPEMLPLQLEELRLNGNHLKRLPNLKRFQKLRVLEVGQNDIEEIQGLPESLEALGLDLNPVKTIRVDCFSSQELYELLKRSLSEEQKKELVRPKVATFARGYGFVKRSFLKVMKNKLNKLFIRHHSLKVQSLFIDESQMKLVVNVDTGETAKVLSVIDEPIKSHISVVEQPNSPKLLRGSLQSGSKLIVEGASNFGTIAAKVVDEQENVYILTCMHIFSSEEKSRTVDAATSIVDSQGASHRVGSSYYGVFKGHQPAPEAGDLADSDEDDDPPPVLVDIALVPVKNTSHIQEFDDIIQNDGSGNCQLYLYKGESSCTNLGQGTKVYKTGAQTGSTSGTIFSEEMLYYPSNKPGREGWEAVMVKSSQSSVFLEEGDSGSLITTNIKASVSRQHDISNHVVALAVLGQEDMNLLVGERTEKCNVGFGAKIHVGLDVLEKEFPELRGLKVVCNKHVLCECPPDGV